MLFAAGGVAEERIFADGSVEVANCVGVERDDSMAVLLLPVVLLSERTDPAGGVGAARGVAHERIGPAGGVGAARGVAHERIGPGGGVVDRPWCCP